MFKNLKNVYGHLTLKRRKQFFLLLLVMLLSSVSEIISLGAVVPFLSVLVAPEFIFENKSAKILIDLLNIRSSEELVLPITIFFIIVTI